MITAFAALLVVIAILIVCCGTQVVVEARRLNAGPEVVPLAVMLLFVFMTFAASLLFVSAEMLGWL